MWFWDQTAAFPERQCKLGRWLGVSHRIGQALCYWILPPSGIALARKTVECIKTDELATMNFIDDLKVFDTAVQSTIGDHVDPSKITHHQSTNSYWDIYDDEENCDTTKLPNEPQAAMSQADDFTADAIDDYIMAEVAIQKSDSFFSATVIERKCDGNGNPIGKRNANPILDACRSFRCLHHRPKPLGTGRWYWR